LNASIDEGVQKMHEVIKRWFFV